MTVLAVAPLRRRALERKGMTPEEELQLLIQEQAKDDETYSVSRPEHVVSMDSPLPSGHGTISDLIGVDDEGDFHCYLPNPGASFPSGFPHGYGGYTKHGCRCRQCKNGNAAYRRQRRSRGQA